MGDTPDTMKSDRLTWMDLEMTGLDPEADEIIEIATIVTDYDLNIIASGPELIIHQPPERFEKMDDWNQQHHTKSGLWDAVVASKISLKEAEAQTLEFLQEHVKEGTSPLAGNSIWQDRRFLGAYMKKIDAHLHYRCVDVSSFKVLGMHWFPKKAFEGKKGSHRALDDIKESIEELKFYKEHYFCG